MAFLLLMGCLSVQLYAQEPSAPIPLRALEGEALAVLTAVDARLLEPLQSEAISFSYRPMVQNPGAPAAPSLWRVRYSWRRECGDRVDFLSAEDQLLAHVPDAPEAQRSAALEQHLAMARGLAGFFRGKSLCETYAGCRGRVQREKVNGLEEVSVILEPTERVRTARTIIHLDKRGVPWKIERTLTNGDRVLQHPQYELHGKRFALQVLQHMETPAVTTETGRNFAYELSWQSVDGNLVPASLTKQSRDPKEPALGTTQFLEVQLGAKVPVFEPRGPAVVR